MISRTFKAQRARSTMIRIAAILLTANALASALDISKVPPGDWIDIFNGKDLTGWVPKIVGTPAGQDPYNTWYVKDGLLWVDYKNYGGQFSGRFGHMAYEKRKFSYYVIHSESDSWGNQIAGGPDWGYQNNGLMLHSQSMESMDLNQGWPTSVECQLLGALNHLNSDQKTQNGTTANVCGSASNTSMIINGSRQSPGCINAKHVQIDTTHFQVVEALVLGDSLVKHMVAGDTGKALDTVLSYTKLQTTKDGNPLTEGYIAIQAETAPWKFRKIRVLDLVGCMDPKYSSYRNYFVKNDATLCGNTTEVRGARWPAGFSATLSAGELRVGFPARADYGLSITDITGRTRVRARARDAAEAALSLRGLRPGLYVLGIGDGEKTYRKEFAVLAAEGP